MKEAYPRASMAQSTLRVVMESEVARLVRQHGRSAMKNEVCGVLIGREEDSLTIVDACIPGANAEQGGAHVTFTQDTWEHIYQVKDRLYPEARIVGWYHSHPGFGVFLSDHDLFIHEHFFSSPQQIAWVYDPHSDEECCFGWRDGKIEKVNDVSFRFAQPCGEVTAPSEEEVVTINKAGEEERIDWMAMLRDVAVWAAFLVIGAVASFFYITHKAHLLPRGEGSALVYIEGDKIGVFPPEVAIKALRILQYEMDTEMQRQQPAGSTGAATGAAAGSQGQGEQNGRPR